MRWFVANPKARAVGVHDPATGERVDTRTMGRRVAALKSAMTRQKNLLVELAKLEAKVRRSLARASRDSTVDRLEAQLAEVRDLHREAENKLYAQEARLEARAEALSAVQSGRPEPKVAKRRTAKPTPVKGGRLPRRRKGKAWVYRVSFSYDRSFKHGGSQTAQVDVFAQRSDGGRVRNPEEARHAILQYIRTGESMPGWSVVRAAWQHRVYDSRGSEKRRKTNPGVTSKQDIDAHLRFFTSGGKTHPGLFRKLITEAKVSPAQQLDLSADGWVVGEEDVNE